MEKKRHLNRIYDSPRDKLARMRPDLHPVDIEDMPDHLVERILEAIQDQR